MEGTQRASSSSETKENVSRGFARPAQLTMYRAAFSSILFRMSRVFLVTPYEFCSPDLRPRKSTHSLPLLVRSLIVRALSLGQLKDAPLEVPGCPACLLLCTRVTSSSTHLLKAPSGTAMLSGPALNREPIIMPKTARPRSRPRRPATLSASRSLSIAIELFGLGASRLFREGKDGIS